MTQTTSIEAFNALKHSGILGKLQLELASAILGAPGKTQAEYAAQFHDREQRSITPRFAELLQMGVIRQEDARKCEITGRKAATFVPTYAEPKKLAVKPRRRDIEEQLKDARDTIDRLIVSNRRLRARLGGLVSSHGPELGLNDERIPVEPISRKKQRDLMFENDRLKRENEDLRAKLGDKHAENEDPAQQKLPVDGSNTMELKLGGAK